MSKEKLEEIADIYFDRETIGHVEKSWLIEYAQEQTERVQELEDRNKFLEKAHRINFNIAEDMKEERTYYREAFDIKTEVHDKLNKDYVTLRKNSKRYREALEDILNNDEMRITNQEIIEKALESEEE